MFLLKYKNSFPKVAVNIFSQKKRIFLFFHRARSISLVFEGILKR